jgi:alpha-mannosidase
LPPEDTYNSPAAPRSILKAEREYLDKNVSEHCLMLFGIGDGGGGPGEEHLERLRREKNLQGLIPVKQEPAINFFEKLAEKKDRYKTWKGELYLEKHQGTLTSQARNKRYNRKIEKSLRELEFAAALNLPYGGAYPSEELETIWKEVLLYQFHDILPGSSITRVYDESLARYEMLLSRVEELTRSFYRKFAAGIDTAEEKQPVAVFNSLPWERKEWLKIEDQWIQVAVPPMGYQVVDAAAVSTPEFDGLTAKNDSLENECIRISFDADGSIRSVFDKKLGREVIATNGRANVLNIYHDDGDAWDFPADYAQKKAAQMKLQDVKSYINGPQAIVEQKYYFGKSTLIQKIVLSAESERIDFKTEVDWQEDGKMLRASFPLNVYTEYVNCEIQFGYLKRPTHRNTSWDFAKDEICAHQWIDLSQPDFGAAILNDCKYGYSANKNVLDIHLLRSPSYPDPQCDRARHYFVYSLLPHEGDFVQAQVYKRGYELNTPLQAIPVIANGGDLPRQYSSLEIGSSHIMIESVKKAEDREAIIVRLYETSGANGTADLKIGFPHKEVSLVDLMENELQRLAEDGNDIRLQFTPFEIKTIQITLPK